MDTSSNICIIFIHEFKVLGREGEDHTLETLHVSHCGACKWCDNEVRR